jgi:hypothetical protein
MKLRTKIILGLLAVSLIAGILVVKRLNDDAMARVGIFSPKGIEGIAFEYVGHGMDPYRPIYYITDKEKIRQVYDALADPHVRTQGAYRMAVIGHRGQVVIYTDAFKAEYFPEYEPDSSWQIFWTTRLFDCESDHSTIPIVYIARIEYSELQAARPTSLAIGTDSRGKKITEMVRRLVRQYNPRSISGSVHADQRPMNGWIGNALRVELSEPISFRELVDRTPDDYSSYSPYTGAHMETISINGLAFQATDYAPMGRPIVRLALRTTDGMWFDSEAVPRREVKGYDKDGNPILGKDLFDELVKELQKPVK